MSEVVKDSVTITRLLVAQLVVFTAVSALLYFKHPFWPVPGLCGGLIAWLPNVIFVLFTQHNLKKTPISSGMSWSFTIAWITKLIVTIILLIGAVQVFKAEFIPLGLGFLSVAITQFLAPVLIGIIRN